MGKMTESAIEDLALERLQQLGYAYLHGPDIAPDSATPLRASLESPLLESKLQAAVDRINPTIPAQARQETARQIMRLSSPDLISANEAFHILLTQGVPVSYQKDGAERGDLVWLVDFSKPDNNEFLAVNQFTVIEKNVNKRPDSP